MPEQQTIEYKQSWYDDYLKWVYGSANAQRDYNFNSFNFI